MITPDQNGVWVELEDLRDTASPAVQEIVSKRFFGKRKKGELYALAPEEIAIIKQEGTAK